MYGAGARAQSKDSAASLTHIAPLNSQRSSAALPRGRPIVAPEGMRGLNVLFDEADGAPILPGPLLMQSLPHDPTVFLLDCDVRKIEVSLDLQKDSRRDCAVLAQYFFTWPQNPLDFYFEHILGPMFHSMVSRAYPIVFNAAIRTAYVCDHLFLASAILAHVVKESGGSVILWPHSANPCHVIPRGTAYFDEVVVLTKSAKRIWQRKFPDRQIRSLPTDYVPRSKGRGGILFSLCP